MFGISALRRRVIGLEALIKERPTALDVRRIALDHAARLPSSLMDADTLVKAAGTIEAYLSGCYGWGGWDGHYSSTASTPDPEIRRTI